MKMTIEKSIANNNTVNIPSVSEKITSTTNDSRMNHKNELNNQQRKKKKLMTRTREVGIKLRSFSSWLCLFLFYTIFGKEEIASRRNTFTPPAFSDSDTNYTAYTI